MNLKRLPFDVIRGAAALFLTFSADNGDMPESETLDIVDMDDMVIGTSTKGDKMAKGLTSRNVAVFIRNGNGKLLMSRRAMHKKVFPGRWDTAACGHVLAGESYKDAAARELKEELGIGCRLRMVNKVFNEHSEGGTVIRYFTGIFLGDFSGSVKLNHELSGVNWLSIQEIEGMIGKNKDDICPFFVKDFSFIRSMLADF
jgi:16S rRNA (adenine1518-N6/adenine1519-N6)-dimethyltransferase